MRSRAPMRHFRKLTLPAMPSARCKMCLRPRGAPRSVRARARMSVSEVRKAGSSDMRRPKQYRPNIEHITRYRRTPEASRLKEKTAEKNLCGLIIFINQIKVCVHSAPQFLLCAFSVSGCAFTCDTALSASEPLRDRKR